MSRNHPLPPPCEWQACTQTASAGPFCYYHAKMLGGLLEPTEEYLTETETNALLYGRERKDGRRLDFYAMNDPVDWDAELSEAQAEVGRRYEFPEEDSDG